MDQELRDLWLRLKDTYQEWVQDTRDSRYWRDNPPTPGPYNKFFSGGVRIFYSPTTKGLPQTLAEIINTPIDCFGPVDREDDTDEWNDE